MMLVRTGKKTSKFEDSDTVVAKPIRAVFEMPHRTSPRATPRLKTAAPPPPAGSEHHRAAVGAGRGSSPRSPLHEKKPAMGGGGGGGGAGAGSRVAELEAKLGKAEGQLADMRDQLAAAEKSRKDARAAFIEASKKRFSVKKRDIAVVAAAASPPIVVGDKEAPNAKPVEAEQTALQVDGDEANEKSASGDEANGVAAIVKDLEENTQSHEVEHLTTKLMAKEAEVEHLMTKLMAKEAEVEHLTTKLTTMESDTESLLANLATKDGEINDLKSKLIAKNADLAAVEVDNADLTKMAKKSAHAARETELALRESAAREARAAERLRASERAREALEAEMQRGRAQSEQWRKAAEEAAAVLGAVDRRGEGMVARDADEHLVGKRKAMRMLSDLWKKKGQK
uniref:Uncharacterized protein n=1 Tax=Leersia perrieri TaxID=77586 RepID=A0A0D9WIM3_9ORYZ